MSKPGHIGFPVPLLGMEPVRLPIYWDDGRVLVLPKPAGVQVWADNWYPRLPVMVEAIRHQAEQGKPELERLGIGGEGLWAVQDPDPECAALTVWAREKAVAEAYKNELGSGNFEFRFRMVVKGGGVGSEANCDLPLARHREEARMVVSHKTGKTAETRFRRLRKLGSYEEWEALTVFPRRHQLLIHALESGLPVVGDSLYARERVVYLSRLKRGYRGKRDREERPLFDGPAYFMAGLRLPDGKEIEMKPPGGWKGLVRQLERSV